MSSVISAVPPESIAFTTASLPFIVAAFQGLILSVVLWFNRTSFGVVSMLTINCQLCCCI